MPSRYKDYGFWLALAQAILSFLLVAFVDTKESLEVFGQALGRIDQEIPRVEVGWEGVVGPKKSSEILGSFWLVRGSNGREFGGGVKVNLLKNIWKYIVLRTILLT